MNTTSSLEVGKTKNSSELVEIIEGENVPLKQACAFKVPLEDVRAIAERLFKDTLFKDGKLRHPDVDLSVSGTYFQITTDSSYYQRGQELYDQIVEPHLRERGYDNNFTFDLMHCVNEAYVNALVYGNEAGIKDEIYTSRGKEVPLQRDANKAKNIILEVLATNKAVVCKITDSGNGIDKETYLKKTEGYRTPIGPNDTPEEIAAKLQKNNGRGIFQIESYTGNVPVLTKNERGFSLSFVYKKGQEIVLH